MSRIGRLLIVGCLMSGAVSGCTDDPVEPLSTCTSDGPVVEITDNHLPSGGDHRLSVPAADVIAGVTKTYDIRGDNVGHTHTVTVTSSHFESLQVGTAVNVTSSNNGPIGIGHDHVVNLSCP